MTCPNGKIRRKSYTRSNGTYVPSTCVKDMGKPGRTPKRKRILPTPSDDIHLSDFGYSTKCKREQRRLSLLKASGEYDTLAILRRLNLLRNYQSNDETKKIMSSDVEYMKKIYKKNKNITKKRK